MDPSLVVAAAAGWLAALVAVRRVFLLRRQIALITQATLSRTSTCSSGRARIWLGGREVTATIRTHT